MAITLTLGLKKTEQVVKRDSASLDILYRRAYPDRGLKENRNDVYILSTAAGTKIFINLRDGASPHGDVEMVPLAEGESVLLTQGPT